jgi:simple sugar transport system permease protein
MYTQSGDPATAVGFELDAIAAVVIGGTLLSGGVGYIFGTAMGVLILGIIQTLITFQGTLNTWWTRIAVGLLVLAFLLLQRAVSTFSRRAKSVGSH